MENGLHFIVEQIKNLLEEARADISRKVNAAMLTAYWEIGRVIVEREQE